MSDYIDRQAAIAYAISGRIRALPTSEDGEDWIRTEEVKQSLLNVPPAEVEPVKHGRWTPVINGRGGFECSICHSYAPSYQDGVEWLSLYCPNCGAKMEKEI